VNAEEPLVFVTVGTDYHAFDRLVSWVDRWLAEEAPQSVRCVVQHGTSGPPSRAEGHEYLDHAKLQDLMAEAAVVVCHGGPATIVGARQSGHLPIVVPRDSSRGEHVDRHQLHFTRRLAEQGLVACCESEDDFRATLRHALETPGDFRVATAQQMAAGDVAVSATVERVGRLVDELLARRSRPAPPAAPARRIRRLRPRADGAAHLPGQRSLGAGTAPEDSEPGDWPAVTVVVPTRDRPDFLRTALASILDQDYPGLLHCLVVFDGTEPDQSLVTAHDGRSVSVMTNQRTPGLAGARNSGILAVATELVAFCDDDDAWLPGKLRRQVAALLADPQASLVSCGIRVAYDGRSVDRILQAAQIELADLLRSRLTELHPSTFVMRTAAVRHGFGLVDEEIPGSYGEDYEFLLRAARKGPIANVPDVLVQVLWHKKSYFASRWETIATALTWLLDRYPEFRTEPRGHARVAGQVAFAEAAQGHRAAAVRWAARTLRANPSEPRAYLALTVASGAVRADSVLRQLHRRGRGL
jgi:UDP-N-acetylglucosamine transferase subunit ALG13/GT2 family glycosyltransferase